MQTLNNYHAGNQVRVEKIVCVDKFCRRLGELGLYIGAEIQIIKNDNSGPLILKIFDSQIALGRVEAEKIYASKI